MSLLKSFVLLNVVEVVPSDHGSAMHLETFHHSSEDTSTNTDITSEGTFLIDVCPINSLGIERRVVYYGYLPPQYVHFSSITY